MKKLLTAIGHLTRTDWAFIHAKAALAVLLMVPLIQLDSVKSTTNQPFLFVWFGMTLLGFGISAVGIVLSAQTYETRRRGFRWEMTGLWLLLAGPLVFSLISAGLWATTGRQRIVAIALCYVIASFLWARMVMIKSAAKSRTVIFRYTESTGDDRE